MIWKFFESMEIKLIRTLTVCLCFGNDHKADNQNKFKHITLLFKVIWQRCSVNPTICALEMFAVRSV